jgi:hypothetical protein
MKNVDDIEVWRLVVEHWRAQGKDLRHVGVPPELASQLGVPMELTERRREIESEEDFEEEPMATKKSAKKTTKKGGKSSTKKVTAPKTVSEPKPVSTAPNEQPVAQLQAAAPVVHGEYENISEKAGEKKWKKRSHFDGESCGYAGCQRKADGYVVGYRATKEGERDRRAVWFGPACTKCVREWHPSLVPFTLAELAHQRNGVSDLAGVLDLEVGEVIKRLAAAGIDEKGRSLTEQQPAVVPTNGIGTQPPTTVVDHAGPTEIIVAQEERHVVAVVVPYDSLAAVAAEMAQTEASLAQFIIRSQPQMDYASNYMQRVKGLWKALDESRKDMGRPFRHVVENIQAHFKPVLDALEKVEGVIKQKINEGMAWSTQQQQTGFGAAQVALAAGNPQGVAQGTQLAVQSEMHLSKGVSMRPKFLFEVVDPTQLESQFFSPDPVKIQAALDALDPVQLQATLAAGYTPIAGCRVWQENTVASRSAA